MAGIRNPKAWKALLSVFIAFGVYLLLPETAEEPARRVAFIFVFAACFWAMEIIPLYATSMVVVLLNIFMLARPGGILDMDRSGYQAFLAPFASPVIILFFGGFVLATALHKYGLDRMIARQLMKLFGKKPFWVMVGMMCTTAFLSMWMSNTATAAMMIVMVRPLYEQLEKDDPFRVGLVLSIPFGANIGGIGTPVGTPPNAIALGILAQHDIHLNFLDWMMMAVPLAIVLLAIIALILRFMFPPKHEEVHLEITSTARLGYRAKGVVMIALLTVVLWLTSGLHGMPEALVGLLGAGLYAATSLLSKEDFKGLDWDVLILMWGGLALGRGMEISGLSEWTVALPIFDHHGIVLIAISCAVAIIMSTVMSNTATATLLIPIMIAIPTASPIMLAITVAISCSFAMALPVSTPPNAIAFASNIIRGQDMFRAGALISVLSLIILLLTYNILIPLAFGF